MTFTRTSVLIVSLLIASAACFAAWRLLKSASPDERSLQMVSVSPAGALEARVYANFWAGPLAVNAERDETVEIRETGKAHDAAHPGSTTAARFDMDSGAVVAVLWRDARHLVVVTSKGTRQVGSVRAIRGIESTVVAYDPRSRAESDCVAGFNRASLAGPVEVSPPACSVLTGPSP